MVELAVVMTVIAMVSTIAFPAFRDMIGNTQIRTVAESIKNGLQQARAEAVKRNQNIRFRINADSSWELGCVTVLPDNDGDGRADCPGVITKKAVKEGSSNNIQLTYPPGRDAAVFTGFGTLDPSFLNPITQVDINNTDVSPTDVRKLSVRLGVGGGARMCDPTVLTTGDPRKC